MVSIGFIGLGDMGGPMATHLVNAGHNVTVFDLRDDAVDRLVDAGATEGTHAGDVGGASEVVFLSLPTPEDVEVVTSELESSLTDGDILVDTSTSTPATTMGIATRLRDSGVAVLGAPVSGGKVGAQAGSLTVMVGGDPTVHEACVPLFDTFASDVFHVGDSPGHGHAVKLLNNYLSFTALVASSEAVLLGQTVGLDIETMCEVFSVSSGRNSAVEYKLPEQVATGQYDMGFPLRLVEKDIRLLTEFGDDNDMPLLLASVVRAIVGYSRTDQGSEADMTRIYDFLEGVMVRT